MANCFLLKINYNINNIIRNVMFIGKFSVIKKRVFLDCWGYMLDKNTLV